jgi:hypothetical protein
MAFVFKQCTWHRCSNNTSRWMTSMSIPYEPMKSKYFTTIIVKLRPMKFVTFDWMIHETKNLAKFSTLCKLQMTKCYCFPIFLEENVFTPLSFDVNFKSNFSQCTNVCSPTLLLLWGWALNACLHINVIVQDQVKYPCEQTIDNYG